MRPETLFLLARRAVVAALAISIVSPGMSFSQEEMKRKDQAVEEPSAGSSSLRNVEIVEVEETEWAAVAGSCDAEEALEPHTPGRLMTLRTGEETYRIFLTQGRAVHCREAELDTENQTPQKIDTALAGTVLSARTDLAGRLSMPLEEIDLVKAERVRWRDSSAGCPEPDRMYMPAISEGARILLAHGGHNYHYHQVGDGPAFLCEHPSKLDPLPGFEIQ